jgi:hypothetical protein
VARRVWRCRLSRACWGRGCCLWRTSSRCRDGESLRLGGRGCRGRFAGAERGWRSLFGSRRARLGLGLVMRWGDRLHSLCFQEPEDSFLDTDLPLSVKVWQCVSLPETRRQDNSGINLLPTGDTSLTPRDTESQKEYRELRRTVLKGDKPGSGSWRGSAL